MRYQKRTEEALWRAYDQNIRALFDEYHEAARIARGNETKLTQAAATFEAGLTLLQDSLDACLGVAGVPSVSEARRREIEDALREHPELASAMGQPSPASPEPPSDQA